MNPLSKFDKDLQFGQAGENWLVWLGSQEAKVEIKTERDIWQETGNLVFEFRCRGKPSGISVTQADWWVHLLSKDNQIVAGYIWSVPTLKNFLRTAYKTPTQLGCKVVNGGDDNLAEIIVVPINQLHLIR